MVKLAGIEKMLTEYEGNRMTGMNVAEMSELIFEYTYGYPFLVSYICKLLNEKMSMGKRRASRSSKNIGQRAQYIV
jgi:hypothetical protein